ncbi:hypothetical protein HRI_001188800 [Hibiscus trionum]|uniref:Ribosome-inactivating protein n=1 Tax=Hibiscus trionum TaxID=183268 RepID=A0A9W7HCR2_HIBTR|nr:hypothetical protein HRI_001188800 [Hibiscus trionum]
MKVLVLLLVVSWGCWISMVQPQELKAVPIVRFTTEGATRNSYLMFMKDLYTALTDRADKSGEIPILPPQSALPAADAQRYVQVRVSNGVQAIDFILDVSNANMLGYRPGGNGRSYFFSDVPEDALYALFPNTLRERLPFSGNYAALEAVAGVGRSEIDLGIGELSRHIYYLRHMTPLKPSGHGTIAKALIVCIQMISEAVRLRNIQQQILAVANPLVVGTYGLFKPDGLTMEYQSRWEDISTAVQSATFGIFANPVRLASDGQELVLTTVREVVFTIAMMPLRCSSPEANPQLLRLPTASTGLDDSNDICERVLEPTSHIMGQNGMCLDVFESIFDYNTKVNLYPCGQNQTNQLWTLGADNTIRSGGKCLTTNGTSPGSNMIIFGCNRVPSDLNKWEILSDGSIINPTYGLFLTANGEGNLLLEENSYGSKQAFYATNNTTPPVTKLVGYEGKCLHSCDDYVFLKRCKSNVTNQLWTIYPDETIRPQKNQGKCLKYGNLEDNTVNIDACDGMSAERWRFQSNGTILHVGSKMVMDVVTDFGEITVSPYIGAVTEIWFQTLP